MSNPTTLTERLEQAGNSAAQSWVITELLLNAYPATIRQSVIAAAVPHWFTAEILAALLDLPMAEAEERYVALQQLSIVQPFGDLGHTLHDLTRSGILAYLAGNETEELHKYSQRVQAYLSSQPIAQDSQTEVESIYHQLIFNIAEGRSILKTRTRVYRNKGNFAAIENLLRNQYLDQKYNGNQVWTAPIVERESNKRSIKPLSVNQYLDQKIGKERVLF